MKISRFPFHPFLFAIYPVLGLLSYNLLEVDPKVGLRPILISVVGALILFLLVRLFFRGWQKAAMMTSLLLVLFFSYGHLYTSLRADNLLGSNFGHRYLLMIDIVIFTLGLWLILTRIKDFNPPTQILNIIGLALLILPAIKVIPAVFAPPAAQDVRTKFTSVTQPLNPDASQPLPDVYVFLMDTYMRSDYLESDFNLDTKPFQNQLKALGFYIAECSRANYFGTRPTVTNLLNFNYLTDLNEDLKQLGYDPKNDQPLLLNNSYVRSDLEAIGYKTVAFGNHFPWLSFEDADVYYAIKRKITAPTTFEELLMNTTAIRLVNRALGSSATFPPRPKEKANISLYDERYQITQYTIDHIDEASKVPGPKFTYIHFLISHVPLVEDSNCQFLTDPNYYSKEGYLPVDENYRNQGYIYSIECSNKVILNAVETILENSKTPPVIVIMGDHGHLEKDNSYSIFNAIYLPDGSDQLYPHISPVNVFRVIFNQQFGTNYELLPDYSYADVTDNGQMKERAASCQLP